MATIVISTPWYKYDKKTGKSIGKTGESHSWAKFLETGIGRGYMLYQSEYNTLRPHIGSAKVVMLRNSKGHRKRAEGRLIDLVNINRPTKNGVDRYDVHFEDQQEVDYEYLKSPSERLEENGVKVFDC